MIRGPQDLPTVRELLTLTDLALAHGNLPVGDRKALVKQRAEIEERLSLAVAGMSRQSIAYAECDPREVCLAHLQREPCPQCAAHAAGL